MSKFIAVAIDGPSGAGKSTFAKMVAKEFGFIYVDTGAIYRTLGLAVYRRGLNCKDEAAVMKVLKSIEIDIQYNEAGTQVMLLDGEDVSTQIRLPEISVCASDVSAHPAVRAALLDMQRAFSEKNSVVMDGRDIGTVVLPNAELKIFLTASDETRAQRRLLELQQKGIETNFEDVLKDIRYRDQQDSSRAAAPLKKAEDAVEIDSSSMNLEQTFAVFKKLVEETLENKAGE